MKRTPICQQWQVSVNPGTYSLIIAWLIAHQTPHPGKCVQLEAVNEPTFHKQTHQLSHKHTHTHNAYDVQTNSFNNIHICIPMHVKMRIN